MLLIMYFYGGIIFVIFIFNHFHMPAKFIRCLITNN